jgi:uncharacterized protein YcnI
MRRHILRAGAVLAVTAGAVLALATAAAAHVTVNPSSAEQGGFTKIAFRVPNEKDNAQTVKLEVNLPTDTPIPFVSLKPVPGWTAATEKTKLAAPVKTDDGEVTEAVTKITWTASAGAGIQPGQFQEFEVSLGPLPETDQMIFKALQTYSDGDIVRWIDEPVAGGDEPEHPAPVLTLTKASGGGSSGEGAAPPAAESDSDSGSTNWLGIIGIALGLAGLVAGLLAYRKAASGPSA